MPLANTAAHIVWMSIGLILVATLSPFNFMPAAWPASGLLRQFFIHPSDLWDVAGNVVMFMPYGLGIAAWMRKQRSAALPTIALVLVASITLSLTVETFQLTLPSRTSSAIDVFNNSMGGLLGGLLYLLWSVTLLQRSLTQLGCNLAVHHAVSRDRNNFYH